MIHLEFKEIDLDSYTDSSITAPVDTVAMIFDASGNRLAIIDDINSLEHRFSNQNLL